MRPTPCVCAPRPATVAIGAASNRTPYAGWYAVPWTQDLSIDTTEFDVAWRVIFGGMTSVMTERIDHPEHGFRWRGERMEWAFARALHLIASHPEA